MELMQIKLSDIVPDENNPRKDFGDLNALARTFEANTYAPGQPYNAIVVVTDGPVYRIADGERRYRAMLINNVEVCNAVVCGDYEEADSMIAMLASDAKEPPTEAERANAVQRALLLGVAPKTVENIGRLKKGQAKKIKTFMDNGMAVQGTIDQILEAYDLREKGADAETVQSVLDAKEEDWKTIASDVRARMKREAFTEEAERILNTAGFHLEGERPADVPYRATFQKLDDLKGALDEGVPEESLWWVCHYPLSIQQFCAPMSADDPQADEEVDLTSIAIETGRRDRAAWYAGALEVDRHGHRIQSTPNIDEFLISRAMDSANVSSFRDMAGSDAPKSQPSELLGSCAEFFYVIYESDLRPTYAKLLKDKDALKYSDDFWIERILWIDAFIADGFEVSSEEMTVVDIIRSLVDVPAVEIEDEEQIQKPAGATPQEAPAVSEAPTVVIAEMNVDMGSGESQSVEHEIDLTSLTFGKSAVM